MKSNYVYIHHIVAFFSKHLDAFFKKNTALFTYFVEKLRRKGGD